MTLLADIPTSGDRIIIICCWGQQVWLALDQGDRLMCSNRSQDKQRCMCLNASRRVLELNRLYASRKHHTGSLGNPSRLHSNFHSSWAPEQVV
jgi:hypothetical protein